MSHSGWETRTVAENTRHMHGPLDWKEEAFRRTEERNDALQKLDKLEAEAAGMRQMLELLKYSIEMGNHVSGDIAKDWVARIDKALSGDAGKETLREMCRLKDTIDLKDVALQSAIGGLKASKIEIELVEHERDEARANMEVLKSQLAEERGMNRNGKIADREQYQMVVDQRTEERDAALRDREDLQKRLSALNDQLLEASQQAVDAKAKLAEVTKERDEAKANECRLSQSFADTFSKVSMHEEGLRERAKKAESQLKTAQKELAEIKDGPPLKQIIESEVSRAVEAERELAKAIRARGKG